MAKHITSFITLATLFFLAAPASAQQPAPGPIDVVTAMHRAVMERNRATFMTLVVEPKTAAGLAEAWFNMVVAGQDLRRKFTVELQKKPGTPLPPEFDVLTEIFKAPQANPQDFQVTIDGDKATVIEKGKPDSTVPLIRKDGAWRVDLGLMCGDAIQEPKRAVRGLVLFTEAFNRVTEKIGAELKTPQEVTDALARELAAVHLRMMEEIRDEKK